MSPAPDTGPGTPAVSSSRPPAPLVPVPRLPSRPAAPGPEPAPEARPRPGEEPGRRGRRRGNGSRPLLARLLALLPAGVREALGIWAGSRAAVLVASVAGAWLMAGGSARAVPGLSAVWDRWDVSLYYKVAQWGYQGYPAHYPDRGIEAFFPGQPALLRLLHAVGIGYVTGGLVISLVAGAVAVGALARLGAMTVPVPAGPPAKTSPVDRIGPRAVLYLVLSPYAVFLFAGYTEALFLGFALPAWLAARRGHWRQAGLWAAAAATVRVNGLFLACSLVVEYVVSRRRAGLPLLAPAGGWLAAPFAVAAGYSTYLYAVTGDWLRWQHAQAEGWGRKFVLPWQAWATSWHAATDPAAPAGTTWAFRAEITAVLVGVALVAVLLRLRRWSEAVYVGLGVAALATSSFYLSVSRATLLWFPLWLLLAQASLRRRWLHAVYLSVSTPLMVVVVVAFTQGQWVG